MASTAVRRLLLKGKAAILDPTMGWKTTNFWGPMANWGIVAAGVLDMTTQGPDMISIPMTVAQAPPTTVQQNNNMSMSSSISTGSKAMFAATAAGAAAAKATSDISSKAAEAAAAAAATTSTTTAENVAKAAAKATPAANTAKAAIKGFHPVLKLQSKICALPMPELLRKFLMYPAGPFTIFFWAPAIKWGISAANLVDYKRPVEKVSIPQQLALFATGVIWARWSFVITPVNYNLALVNVCLASTAFYHLMRKLVYDPFPSSVHDNAPQSTAAAAVDRNASTKQAAAAASSSATSTAATTA
ncbi:Mitochondrial pyruvate carrier 2 [Perkinsus chesapeaki]|uniref:Mitochondrial pyruvate carrier n=2 Tax=Alveolata TaxID=33630 RepID=A0A7J6M1Z4_PERCH|nr:Mitochondrial pyruvate carrier 2 [Perkinsus chesapeaki]